ncbi:hypothetical protein LINGRAHAP2_LOCUS8114, partial [Linum grandiflorum]
LLQLLHPSSHLHHPLSHHLRRGDGGGAANRRRESQSLPLPSLALGDGGGSEETAASSAPPSSPSDSRRRRWMRGNRLSDSSIRPDGSPFAGARLRRGRGNDGRRIGIALMVEEC